MVGKNFEAFYSYNASENYALAIAHLSDLISQNNTNVNFATPWPTDDPGITRRQTREIQQALINRGYDIGAVDGMIGEKSRLAIQDFQRQQGVNPDGKAGLKLYNLLVAGGAKQTAVAQPTFRPTTPSMANNGRVVIRRVDTGNTMVSP